MDALNIDNVKYRNITHKYNNRELLNENSMNDIEAIKFIDKKTKTINNNNNKNNVYDVACYLLSKMPNKECTTMKLHKLLYYCQAWSMVWEEKSIFPEKIEAWVNGPVIRNLFVQFKGYYVVKYSDIKVLGNENILTDEQKEIVDKVIKFFYWFQSILI